MFVPRKQTAHPFAGERGYRTKIWHKLYLMIWEDSAASGSS